MVRSGLQVARQRGHVGVLQDFDFGDWRAALVANHWASRNRFECFGGGSGEYHLLTVIDVTIRAGKSVDDVTGWNRVNHTTARRREFLAALPDGRLT